MIVTWMRVRVCMLGRRLHRRQSGEGGIARPVLSRTTLLKKERISSHFSFTTENCLSTALRDYIGLSGVTPDRFRPLPLISCSRVRFRTGTCDFSEFTKPEN